MADSFDKFKLLQEASKVASQTGIPEDILVGVIMHESGFDTSATGNGGGIGQVLESTAEGLGVTQKELRDSPELAIQVTARILHDNAAMFGGDYDKAAAAYFVGPGTIQAATQGPGNWLDNADALAKKYNQGTVTDYLSSVHDKAGTAGITGGSFTRDALHQKTADQIIKENNLTTATSPATTSNSFDASKLPDINDFYNTDPSGTRYLDTAAYTAALQAHQAFMTDRDSNRAYNLGPLSQYIDDTISQVTAEISAGNLSVSKASTLFQDRLSAYSTALDAYSSKSFTQGAPVGADYVPGREPGGFNDKVLGLAPVRASHDVVLDPMAEAVKQYTDAKNQIDAISVPTVPNVAAMRAALYSTVPTSQGGVSIPGTNRPPDPLTVAASNFGGQTYNSDYTSQNEGTQA